MAQDRLVEASSIVEQVRAYAHDVLHSRVRPRLRQCPGRRCGASAPVFFRRHEVRHCTFLATVGDMVQTVLCRITR